MEGFWKTFTTYFRSAKDIKRHFFKESLLVFLSYLILFVTFAFLVRWFLDFFLMEKLLTHLGLQSSFIRLFSFISKTLGNPLLLLFLPILLYLAYQSSLLVASFFTGVFLDRLSLSAEKAAGSLPESPLFIPVRSPFLFGLLEELKLLAINISWTGLVFLLSLSPLANENFLLILFLTGIIFFEGWHYLSYPFLRWRVPMVVQGKIYFKNLRTFWGFSLAASSGFWAIYFALGFLPYGSMVFLSIFALLALFKPLGVVAATRLGMDLFVHGRSVKPRGKGGRFLEIFSLLLALLMIFTFADFISGVRSKQHLFQCSYRLTNLEIELPDDSSDDPVDKLLSYAKLIASPQIKGVLDIENKSGGAIEIEDLFITGYLGKHPVAVLSLKGFTLDTLSSHQADLLFKINPLLVGYALLESLAQQNTTDIQIKIWVNLDLWLGKVPYVLLKL